MPILVIFVDFLVIKKKQHWRTVNLLENLGFKYWEEIYEKKQ